MLPYFTQRRILRKNQRALSNRKNIKKDLKVDFRCSAWQSMPKNTLMINIPNFVGWLRAFDEAAKCFLKLAYLNRRQVLIKNHRAIFSRKSLRRFLMLGSGCTGWECTPQNKLRINMSNYVGCLKEPPRKDQKVF